MTNEEKPQTGDESRRSFMKKGAVASGLVALGAAGVGTAAAQDQASALVFSYDYYPGAEFTVTASLQQSTTTKMLQTPGGQNISEISSPADYNGYAIGYSLGGSPIYSYLFTKRTLQQGNSYSIGEEAQVLSSRLNLLSTSISRGSGSSSMSSDNNSTNSST
ncbi:MAG: hypothetical protein ABEJ31_12835 [Haloarculaceae archaeon]